MQKKTGMVVLGTLLGGACGLGLVVGLVFIAGQQSVLSAPAKLAPSNNGAKGWQTYKDARLGFTVARPGGWTVQANSRSIVVQDPSRSETVLMEVFTASPGDTAEAHLNMLAEEHAALFPGAEIGDVSPQESKGEEVTAALSFGAGMGAGRALCSLVNGKGLLFVLAAPSDTFAANQLVLARIVKSLRFTVPAASAAPAKSAGRLAAAQASAAVRGLRFVSWTDPHEQGFHVNVPQGWKAEGGVFHSGPGDLRIAYDVTSPAKDMQVVIGDPRLPGTLVTPNEMLGAREGMNGCFHYMEAAEFNRWYLDHLMRPVMDSLTIGTDHPLPEVSRRRTAQAQQMFGSSAEVEVSVGITEFSGQSKLTHKPITGIVIGSTQRMTSRGFGGETTTWVPTAMMLTCNDDAAKARNQQIVMAVFARLLQSYRENPAWANRLAQEGAASGEQMRQNMAQNTQQMIEQSKQRTAQIARSSDAAREASMGAYWGHVDADNARQRGFANWMGDRTDVSGGGETTNVQSGSSHYYRNAQTETVIGTDSADSPGVDFTPLTER